MEAEPLNIHPDQNNNPTAGSQEPPPKWASLNPDKHIEIPLHEMTLEEVVKAGASAQQDENFRSVRTRVTGFDHSRRHLRKVHGLRHNAFLDRMASSHGLALLEASDEFKECREGYELLSNFVDSTYADNADMEVLEEAGIVRYMRGRGTTMPTRISTFDDVSLELDKHAPILGLSFGQLLLAVTIWSICTHPKLPKQAQKSDGLVSARDNFKSHMVKRGRELRRQFDDGIYRANKG